MKPNPQQLAEFAKQLLELARIIKKLKQK